MRLSDHIWIAWLAAALCVPPGCAGQQQGASGQRAEPTPPTGEAATDPKSPAPPPTSVPPALSPAEELTAGTRQKAQSYLLPSFQFSEMGDSNFSVVAGPQRWETVNTFVGRLALQRVGKLSKVTTDYMGGGQVYNHHSELNATMHQFGITQTYQGARWGWLFDDRVSYLPESAFGYGGFGWMGSLGPGIGGPFGSNLANLNPMFSPNQTIYSGRGDRVANTAIAEVQYAASPRSSFSVGGSYGLLHFRTPGSIDSRNALFTAGYNRALSARDTVGITYGFNLFQFRRIGRSFKTHIVGIDFGHRVTGRLAVQAGGGAQLNVFRSPAAGQDTSPSWIAHGSINYNVSRSGFALSFSRYTSNGGGVLAGANTELVQFSWNQQLTRHWSGSLGPGYARNSSLPQTTSGKTESTYDSVYAGASISRSFGPHTTMFLTYRLENQVLKVGPCPAGGCRTSLLRHVVGLGFDWHPRQIRID